MYIMDNYYSSPELYATLYKCINAVGTVWSDSRVFSIQQLYTKASMTNRGSY